MNTKTLKPIFSVCLLLLGLVYFLLDRDEQQQKQRLTQLVAQLTQLQKTVHNLPSQQEMNQHDVSVLEKNTKNFFQLLQVLLAQSHQKMVFDKLTYEHHFIALSGKARSAEIIIQLIAQLTAVITIPITIRSIIQTSNDDLHFELVTENAKAES